MNPLNKDKKRIITPTPSVNSKIVIREEDEEESENIIGNPSNKQVEPIAPEQLRLAFNNREIHLGSCRYDVSILGTIVHDMLQDKTIREFLNLNGEQGKDNPVGVG